MARDIAPTACPKCGEEKLWGSDTDVRPQQVRTMLFARIFLGWLPSFLIAKNKKGHHDLSLRKMRIHGRL